MKKRRKIKWNNIISLVLIIDMIRTFCILAFNVTACLTWFGVVVLAIELITADALLQGSK